MADSLVAPPVFSGTPSQDAGDWMRQFRNYCTYKNLSEGQMCNLFRVMLVGNAADWLETLALDERFPTFDKLRQAFFSRYKPPEVAKYKSAKDIFSRTQDEAESVDSFIDKMLKSAAEAERLDRRASFLNDKVFIVFSVSIDSKCDFDWFTNHSSYCESVRAQADSALQHHFRWTVCLHKVEQSSLLSNNK